MEGLVTAWHENGQKAQETTFKGGKLDGPATKWDKDGNVTDQTRFKDGVEVKEWSPWVVATSLTYLATSTPRQTAIPPRSPFGQVGSPRSK